MVIIESTLDHQILPKKDTYPTPPWRLWRSWERTRRRLRAGRPWEIRDIPPWCDLTGPMGCLGKWKNGGKMGVYVCNCLYVACYDFMLVFKVSLLPLLLFVGFWGLFLANFHCWCFYFEVVGFAQGEHFLQKGTPWECGFSLHSATTDTAHLCNHCICDASHTALQPLPISTRFFCNG
jgi:hypothetical protein